MKTVLLGLLIGIGLPVGYIIINKPETKQNTNSQYLVQAPGLIGPNMTYICNNVTTRGTTIVFLDCTNTFTNESVSEIFNGIAIKLEKRLQ